MLDATGGVLTNFHVVQGGALFRVRFLDPAGTSKTYRAFPKACAVAHDLAVLSVLNTPALRPISRATSEPPVGARVFAVGSPLSLQGTISEGIISQYRELDGSRLIQTTAAISPGSSGGGLFNDRAELIGVTTLTISAGQSLNFAVPLVALKSLEECSSFPALPPQQTESTIPPATEEPVPVPCSTPALTPEGTANAEWQDHPYGPSTVTITGFVRNTGCQEVADVEAGLVLVRTADSAPVTAFRAKLDRSRLAVGERGVYQGVGTLTSSGQYRIEHSEWRFAFVDAATGLLIPRVVQAK